MLLVTARLTGMFLVAPVYSHKVLPVRLRVGLALAVAVAVLGRLAQPVAMPADVVALALAVGIEAGLGAAIGYAACLLFVGVELGAAHVGQQIGIGLRGVIASQGAGGSHPVGMLFRLVALVTFLAIGGHRDMMAAMLTSFKTVPLGAVVSPEALGGLVVGLLSMSFVLALQVAAPVLIALLLATVALGFLQKTIPQCHVLSTDPPIRALLGLLVLAVSVAAVVALVEGAWGRSAQAIGDFVRTTSWSRP